MNPAEIYDALAALAAKPYDPVEFPFEFAAATDNNPGTLAKLGVDAVGAHNISLSESSLLH